MSGTSVASFTVTGVDIPYERPIQTAAATIKSAAWALIDLRTSDGVCGRAYVRCYTPAVLYPVVAMARGLEPLVRNRPLAPVTLWSELRTRFRLLGCEGVVGLALNLVDMAIWDALARTAELPLAALLGAEPKSVTAYRSLRAVAGPELLDEAEAALAEGFGAMKLKVGGRPFAEDYEALTLMRERVGDDCELMCDYNQSLTVDEARYAERELRTLRLRWIEEPLPAADLAGYGQLLKHAETPIQAGESWWSPEDAARSVAAKASSLMMLDVGRIGGVTGWLRAAAGAQTVGLRLSSHTFPEFSVHLLAAAPNADLLEWLDSAAPLVTRPLTVEQGRVSAPQRPGVDLDWDAEKLAYYAVT